jgi:transposase InsO family protein
MNIISRIPHTIKTRIAAVNTYRNNKASVEFICRKYHISKASLMRWNKLYDGSDLSLKDKSHRPLSTHPNAHTDFEARKIEKLIKRNPHIGLNELYTKLRIQISYSRHYTSLYRFLKKSNFYKTPDIPKKKVYVPKPYNTPVNVGEKWQMDVKYVPKPCYSSSIASDEKFYQYTVIDEASRERFIFPFKEQSSYSTVEFLKRAISYFGYIPKCIQTDNGFEFAHFKDTLKIHPFDKVCMDLGIKHQLIRPRTPRHNGKVERSHRNDNERFYRFLKFYSYEDLLNQMKRYLYKSNRILTSSLNWKSPIQQRKDLINNGLYNYTLL